MRFLPRLALAAGLILTLGASAGLAQSISGAQRGEIEKIVREYLIQHPEVLQEAMAELEKKQAADEAAKNSGRGQGQRRDDLQFAASGRDRQSAGRRHLRRVLRLQLRLLQARHGRHVRADEERSQAQGRAQGVSGARAGFGRGRPRRGRRPHAGQDRQEVHGLPPEAAERPRPGRQGARARGRQGGRDGRGADRARHGRATRSRPRSKRASSSPRSSG